MTANGDFSTFDPQPGPVSSKIDRKRGKRRNWGARIPLPDPAIARQRALALGVRTALDRLRRYHPDGYPTRIAALLEEREFAFVAAVMAPGRGTRRLLEDQDARLLDATLEALAQALDRA